MASELHALRLMPDPATDPDAKLFELLDEQAARNAEWRKCENDQDRGRVLRKWNNDYISIDVMIAEVQPKTLQGLLAKADFSLGSWREHAGPNRYMWLGAKMATCLEQAIATLAVLHDGPAVLKGQS